MTKVRWVVEAVNGRLKTQFRALHHIVQNTNIESKLMELKICCAILNKYGERFISDKDNSEFIANRILSRMDSPQKLHGAVKENSLTARGTDF